MSDLRPNNIVIITFLVSGLFIGLTSPVCADPGVNATPETQSLSTVTTTEVIGLAMETDVGGWTLTNNPGILYSYGAGTETLSGLIFTGASAEFYFNAMKTQLEGAGGSLTYSYDNPDYPGLPWVHTMVVPESLINANIPGTGLTYKYQGDNYFGPLTIIHKGIHTGILDPGQVQYTTAYDANIVAQGGKTSFIRQMTIDTRNKVTGQSNVNVQTELTFAATEDGGNVVGEENLMLDGAGDTIPASERMLCPFTSSDDAYIPAFCNIVQSGSKYDLTIGSVTTSANERFVGTDASDAVVMNYAINVKPYGTSQGQIPAGGSAMAYIKAHVQESRDCYACKASDMTYTETASVFGTITSFRKEMSYSSQISSVAVIPPVF